MVYLRKTVRLDLGPYSAFDKLRKMVSEEEFEKCKNVNLNSNKIFDYYGEFDNLTFSVEELNIYENDIKYSFGIKGKFNETLKGCELTYYYNLSWIMRKIKRNYIDYIISLFFIFFLNYTFPEKYQLNDIFNIIFVLCLGFIVYLVLSLFIGRDNNSIERFTDFIYDVFDGHIL